MRALRKNIDKKKLAALAKAGKNITEISVILHEERHTIKRHLKRYGLIPRSFNYFTKGQFKKLIQQGLTKQQIADKLNIKYATAKWWLAKFNLKTKISGRVKDVIGKRFGLLVVLKFKGFDKQGNAKYLCKCDCGAGKIVNGHSLKWGNAISCGCYRRSLYRKIKNFKSKYKWYYIYNGHKFLCRSSYEALYINHLIQNKIAFLYEPKLFRVSPYLWYLPDLYIPQNDLYIEIKGWFSKEAKEKVRLFKKQFNLKVLHWEQIRHICKIKCSYGTMFHRAKKLNVSIEDYIGKMLYLDNQIQKRSAA